MNSACLLTGNPSAQAHYSVARLEGLMNDLPLKSLSGVKFHFGDG